MPFHWSVELLFVCACLGASWPKFAAADPPTERPPKFPEARHQVIPYERQNQSYARCEEPDDFEKGWGPVPPWTNSGANLNAIVIMGSVSYASAQAHEVSGLQSKGGDFEFVAIGPLARQYERKIVIPNNGQVDLFLFSWAPTVELQEELLRLYRPFASRFENQTHWLPRMEKALEAVYAQTAKDANYGKAFNRCKVHIFSLSQYISAHLSLGMM